MRGETPTTSIMPNNWATGSIKPFAGYPARIGLTQLRKELIEMNRLRSFVGFLMEKFLINNVVSANLLDVEYQQIPRQHISNP